MRYIRRYNESRIIKVTDDTISEIVSIQISKLGNKCYLNHIDVSEVTNMSWMFHNTQFNGDISKWDVGNVQNMGWMFDDSPFNGDISNWNVHNVRDMYHMFFNSKFRGDISNWNVGNVNDMSWMFNSSQFNGDLSNWNVKKLKYIPGIFSYSPLEGREPWWFILGYQFINRKSMYDSIEVYEWIDLEKKVIWKKRLNYALQDFGKEDFKIPESIWGFVIQ